MQYIVTSRGLPIGVTDLGFVRIGGPLRSGWFHPNADGDRLMPAVTAMHAAIHACGRAWRAEREAGRRETPPTVDTALHADLAEALQHVEALELGLRREDGSVVPTEHVGIQDTEKLLDLAWHDWDDDEPPPWDAEPFDPSDYTIEHVDIADETDFLEELEAEFGEDFSRDFPGGEEERVAFPRYQIHVVLAEGAEVP